MKDDTSGATAVEYGLIVALIVLAMLVSMQLVANETLEIWGHVEDKSLEAMGA
jgi:pilus assembly protein Flp/PilA